MRCRNARSAVGSAWSLQKRAAVMAVLPPYTISKAESSATAIRTIAPIRTLRRMKLPSPKRTGKLIARPRALQSKRAYPAPARVAEGSGEGLIPVMLRLERAFLRHANIAGLVVAQLGELHADLGEVQPRDLLVELLRQSVDLFLVLAVLVVRVELDLRQGLVGEG